jgi:hypothetical protein
MKKLRILFYFIIALGVASCDKANRCDCFKSTGSITREHRTIPGFNKISVSDNINLYILQDTFCSIIVEAGEHLISSIKTEVTDSCIYLTNENKCNWVRSFKNKVNIYLRYKRIKGLIYNTGSGNISTMDTLYTDYFQFDDIAGSGNINFKIVSNTSWFNLHTGPADLTVSGRSGVSYLYSAGNGKADLSHFPSGFLYITNNSTNNCYTNVEKLIEAQIGYVGDIYYTGNPYSISTKITGSGKLIKTN